MASGSIPWVISSWPYTYKGGRYIDGCYANKNPQQYLNTDIKVLTEATPYKGSPVQEKYGYKCRYPNVIKTSLHGTISQYEDIWSEGYEAGKTFIQELKESGDAEGTFFRTFSNT